MHHPRSVVQPLVDKALDHAVFALAHQGLVRQSPMCTALDLSELYDELAEVNITDLVHAVHDYQQWYRAAGVNVKPRIA